MFSGKWDVKKDGPRPHVFRSAQEAELSYEGKRVSLHDLAEYRRRHHTDHTLTTVGRIIFNERVERALEDALGDEYDPSTYLFVNTPLKKRNMSEVIERRRRARPLRHGAGARRVQGARLPLREPARHHDLQERRLIPPEKEKILRAMSRASRRSRSSTTPA